MLISPAFADEVPGMTGLTGMAAVGANPLVSMLPILLVIVVFYFMVIRPQTMRIQQHSKMIKSLEKGSKVVTGGGLVATVVKLVGEDEVVLRLAEGVDVTAIRSTIMMLRTPGQKK
jgi:preprotein translocase subunit YajC